MPSEASDRVPGQRMTSQRRLLFDLLRDADGHLDADELFRRAKEADPRISLSTVYRNLQLFKAQGLVTERHFVEDHHYYEIKDSAEHYHLVCRSCGKVTEVENPLTEEMKRLVEKRIQFQITDIEVNMQGYCPKCQGENKP
ncbi:MAG: Fur family transcriptional regulator [Dehalococcoidia bacterium]